MLKVCNNKLLFMVCVICLLANNIYAKQQKKIFISKFEAKKIANQYSFYKSSLPRSIRSVLRKKNHVIFSNKVLNNKELLKQKCDFIIKGKYKVEKGMMKVSFSVIHVKTTRVVIIAIASGYPDFRIFTLIDAVSKLVNDTLKRRIKVLLSRPTIMLIDENGKISVSTKDSMDGFDLSDLNLKGINLSGRNLTNVNFKNSNLSNSDLSRTNVRGANFTGVDYSGMKSMKKCLNFKKAKMSKSMINQVYVHNLMIFANIGLAASTMYGSTGHIADLAQDSLAGVADNGFTFKFEAGAYYFFTGLLGVYGSVSYGHYILFEQIPAYDTNKAYRESYVIDYLNINFAVALRFYNFLLFAGGFLGFPLGFNHEDYYSIRTSFGVLGGFGYKFRLSVKFYLYVGFQYKLQLTKWGKHERFSEDQIGGSKFMSFFLDVSFMIGFL